MAARTPRELVDAYVDATNRGDWALMRSLLAPDYLEDYPQSGERVTGPDAAIGIRAHYSALGPLVTTRESLVGGEDRWALAPNFTAVRVTGEGDVLTIVLRAAYPDGQWWVIAILEVRDGLVGHQTAYFAQDFDAPEWRQPWVSRIPPTER